MVAHNIQWRALVTLDRPAGGLTDDQAETLTATVPGYGIITDDGHRLTIAMTVTAATLRQATDEAQRATRDAWAVALAGARATPRALQVLTVDDYDREQARPGALELVGLAEIAELLDVSHQRVAQLTERPDFPAPVAELAQGRVFTRASVDVFERGWQRTPGRPPKGGR